MTESPQAQPVRSVDVPSQSRGEVPAAAAQPAAHRREDVDVDALPVQDPTAPPPETGWAGMVAFGSMMMIMAGAFSLILGLTALFKDDYYLVRAEQLVVSVDFTTWGWVHVGLGALAVVAGFSLLMGQMWARVVAIALAFVSAVVNLAFLSAYPLWSLTIITLDVLVIYAVAVHGDEIQSHT